jgi:hypothetical protein
VDSCSDGFLCMRNWVFILLLFILQIFFYFSSIVMLAKLYAVVQIRVGSQGNTISVKFATDDFSSDLVSY